MSFETWVQIGVGIVLAVIAPLLNELFWRSLVMTLAGFCFAVALWQYIEDHQWHRGYLIGGCILIAALLSSIIVWSVPARLVQDKTQEVSSKVPDAVSLPPTQQKSTSPPPAIGNIIDNKGIITQGQSGGTNTIINQGTLSPKDKKELKARIQKTKELRISVNQFIATMTVLRDNAIFNPNTMHEINEFDQEMGRILRQHLGHDEGTAIQVRITNVRMATNVQIDTQLPPIPRQADYHARARFENLTNFNRELDATIRDLESRL